MRSIALASLAGCLALTTGCATLSALTGGEGATKLMLVTTESFNAAAEAELQAKASGLLTGSQASQADEARRKAYSALLVARAAYHTGRTPDVASVTALVASLTALTPKAPAP